jgi:hypothetical protein
MPAPTSSLFGADAVSEETSGHVLNRLGLVR